MSQPEPNDSLRSGVEASWHRFLDLYEPLRPELYRYCRHLTRSPWDADDLAQDVLFRAFVKLGSMNEPPPHPRAWLFRVASNLWIDRLRAAHPQPEASEESAPGTRVRNYFYTPDVLAEVCAELQVPFRSNGVRYWRPLT